MKRKLLDETDTEIIIRSMITVFNPNQINFSANNVELSIFIDTSYIGVASIEDDIVIYKNDTATIKCLLYIQKDCLSPNLQIKDSVSVSILGVSSMPFIKKDFYFELHYKIDVSEYIMPIAEDFLVEDAIKVKSVNIKDITLNHTNLEIVFELDNNTNLNYELSKLNIDLYNNNSYSNLLGSTNLDSAVFISADTLNTFRSNVKLNNVSMGTTLFSNTIKKSNFLYMIADLVVKYNELELPLTLKKKISYNPLTFEIKIHE